MNNVIETERFMEWLDDLDCRSFYNSDVLDELSQYGFDVSFVPADSSSRDNKYHVALGESSVGIHVNTWQDDFQALLDRGLPFFVIDESHLGEPEYHDGKNAGYAIVNPADVNMQQLSMLGAGYIYKNAKALAETTVVGGNIIRALARLIANKSPGDDFHGRGFAARADMKAIKEALGCYNGADEV